MLNYEPDAKLPIPEGMLERAAELGLQVVKIFCEEPNARVGDHTGVDFHAAVPCVPRIGEQIWLDDGTSCEVKMVAHKVITIRAYNDKPDMITLAPFVYAVRISKKAGDE